MATTLDSLSAADRADFQKRLGIFGLDETGILQPDLVVPANTTLTLSASDPRSFIRPRLLATNDLDQIKKWIGVDDQLFEQGKLQSTLAVPAPLRARAAVSPTAGAAPGAAGAVDLQGAASNGNFRSSDLDNLRTAATAYIWGHSPLAASYKSAVQLHFPSMQVALWPFFTITVNAGSVLQLGPGQNVLCAYKIVIHQGGTVRASGGLTVQSTVVQKILNFIPIPFPIHLT